MKRLIAFFAALAIVSVALISCMTEPDSPSDVTTEGDVTSADVSGSSDLPELDFDGATITIMHRASTGEFTREFENDVTATDLVDQAVYFRNRNVEAQLHVVLDYEGNESTDWNTGYNARIITDVESGDGIYDVFSGPSYHVTTPMTTGCYADLSKAKYINLNKAYWSNGLTDGMAIDGKVFLVTGDISLGLVKYLHCFIFNKEMFDSYWNGTNIYEIVDNGEWTVDNLARLIKGIYRGVDPVSENKEADTYGFAMTNTNLMRAFIDALGCQVVHVNEEGSAEVWEENQSHVHDVITQMYDLFASKDVVYLQNEDNSKGYKMFKESRALFILSRLVDISTTYREIKEFEFGLLPIPVYNEGDPYYNTICGSESAFAVSSVRTGDGLDRAAAVLEALAAESYKTVTPVYYNEALKIKYDMNNDDGRMLDLIHDGAVFDPSVQLSKVLMGNSVGSENPDYAVTFCMLHNSNWISYYNSLKNVWNNGLEGLTETVRNLGI